MCRWLAYSGSPILLEELLYRPRHSLIDQSLHSRLGVETTNGDGFGVGWYGTDAGDEPPCSGGSAGLERPQPAGARPLESARRCSSPTSGPAPDGCPADQLPPVPPRAWLWVHNGAIATSPGKRELTLAVDPELFRLIEVDRLRDDVLPRAHARPEDDRRARCADGRLVEAAGRHGVEHPLQMTVATTDGESVWAFRYSSEGKSRLRFSTAPGWTRCGSLPGARVLREVSDETRLIVSEPIVDLPGASKKTVPESSYGVIQEGEDELHEFRPR